MLYYLHSLVLSIWTATLAALGIKASADPLLPTVAKESSTASARTPLSYSGLDFRQNLHLHVLNKYKKMKAREDAKRKRNAAKCQPAMISNVDCSLDATPGTNAVDVSPMAASDSVLERSLDSSPDICFHSANSSPASTSPTTSPRLTSSPDASCDMTAMDSGDLDDVAKAYVEFRFGGHTKRDGKIFCSSGLISASTTFLDVDATSFNQFNQGRGIQIYDTTTSESEVTYPADDAESFHCRDARMWCAARLEDCDSISDSESFSTPPSSPFTSPSLPSMPSLTHAIHTQGMTETCEIYAHCPVVVEQAASESKPQVLDDTHQTVADDNLPNLPVIRHSVTLPIILPLRVIKRPTSLSLERRPVLCSNSDEGLDQPPSLSMSSSAFSSDGSLVPMNVLCGPSSLLGEREVKVAAVTG